MAKVYDEYLGIIDEPESKKDKVDKLRWSDFSCACAEFVASLVDKSEWSKYGKRQDIVASTFASQFISDKYKSNKLTEYEILVYLLTKTKIPTDKELTGFKWKEISYKAYRYALKNTNPSKLSKKMIMSKLNKIQKAHNK